MTNMSRCQWVRKAQGHTVAEVAADVGISERALRRLEGGEVQATVDVTVRVYRALGLVAAADALEQFGWGDW